MQKELKAVKIQLRDLEHRFNVSEIENITLRKRVAFLEGEEDKEDEEGEAELEGDGCGDVASA
ncbi:hypothetical protein IMZ48_36755 [Candidatus Bathyarchaeota archaeon]|nr:hypothetical protein [Candidatus Bathyarchaeota archaeon]